MSNTDIDLEDLELDAAPTEPVKTAEPKIEPQTAVEEGAELPVQEGVEEAPTEAKPSRADLRIQKLIAANRAAEEAAAKAREEAVAERARREMLERMHQQPTGPDPREEEQRLAEMSPQERSEYQLRKDQKALEFQVAQMRFENANAQDKSAYDARAQVDPVYAKYAAQVEERILGLYKTGQVVPRETVLKFLIGEAVLSNKSKSKAQAEAGKKNLETQRAAPVAAKGDQSGSAKPDERAARLKRLENMSI